MATNANKAYDVVVIGAGNGGLVAAIRVLQAVSNSRPACTS